MISSIDCLSARDTGNILRRDNLLVALNRIEYTAKEES